MPQEMISYSSNLEDVLLARALKHVERGFYIDIGANDPVNESLTKIFYDRGWRGVNVEPIQYLYDRLVAARVRDINLNIAISDRRDTLQFHEVVDASGLSSLDEAVAAAHERIGFKKRRSYQVKADTLSNICKQYVSEDIHFLKIDVEGAEAAVIRGADLRSYRPWIIVVEATVPNTSIPTHEEWELILLNAEYQFVLFDGCNRFYVASEHAELNAAFSIPVDSYKRYSSQILEDRLAAIGRLPPVKIFRKLRSIVRRYAAMR
jgi:FkbM family methyltransferase